MITRSESFLQNLLLLACLLGSGCAGVQSGPPKHVIPNHDGLLMVTQQTGGVYHRTIIIEGLWYQTHRDRLLVIDPTEDRVLKEVAFGPPGRFGSAVDMLVFHQRLFVVLEDDGLAEMSLDQPRDPKIINFLDARTLDISPRRLSVVDDQLYISGKGGVVRLSDQGKIFTSPDDVGRVVKGDAGLIACIGRRVYRLSDQSYIGSASELYQLPPGYGPGEHLFFTRHLEGGSLVGVMTPRVRELNTKSASIQVPGVVRNVRFHKGLIWAIGEQRLIAFRIEGEQLRKVHDFEVPDVSDADLIDENYLALAGGFGRGMLRITDDEQGAGGAMIKVHSQAGRISRARSDGRQILAEDSHGRWLYRMADNQVQRTDEAIMTIRGDSVRSAITMHARVEIEEGGRNLLISMIGGGRGEWVYSEPDRSTIHCVQAVGGEIWIGHDRGITVLSMDQDRLDPVVARQRLPGPVLHLAPLLSGNGAGYASSYGGFGVITMNREFLDPKTELASETSRRNGHE